MNSYNIRCTPIESDIKRVKEILEESKFFSDNEVTMGVSLVRTRLNNSKNCSYKFVFIEKDETVVGYSCYGFIEGTKKSYDIYWIAVDQTYKRSGYGSVLLKTTEEAIKNNGGQNVYIETSSTLKYLPTRKFYIDAGYKVAAEIKDFYDVNDNKVIYSKSL